MSDMEWDLWKRCSYHTLHGNSDKGDKEPKEEPHESKSNTENEQQMQIENGQLFSMCEKTGLTGAERTGVIENEGQ